MFHCTRFPWWLVGALLLAPVVPSHAQERRSRYSPGLVLETGARHAACDELLFDPTGRELLATGDDKVVRIWPVGHTRFEVEATRTLRWPTFREASGNIFAMALSPDVGARSVAIAGHGGLYPGLVVVLDRKTGAVQHALLEPLTRAFTWSLAWSPDGRFLVFGTEMGQVFRWELGQKRPILFAASPLGRENRIRRLAFLDARRILCVSREGRIQEFDLLEPDRKSARLVGQFTSRALLEVILSPDRRWLAGCGENVTGEEGLRTDQVEVFDLRHNEGSKPARLVLGIPQGENTSRFTASLAFDPESRHLAVGTRDARHPGRGEDTFARLTGGRVHVWSLGDGRSTLHTRQGLDVGYRVDRLAFRPRHPGQLATAGGPNHEVRLWDWRKEGRQLDEIRSPGSCLWSVAMSQNGKYLAWKEQLDPAPGHPNERGTGPWRVFTLDQAPHAILNREPADFRPILPLRSHGDWRLVTTENAFVWGVEGPGKDGQREFTELTDRNGLYLTAVNQIPRCYTFLPPRDGTGPVRLAIGHMWGVTIYELSPGKVRLARLMHGHEGEVMAVAPAAGGSLLLTASRDQTIACWSLEDWPSQGELGGSFATRGETLVVREIDPGSPAWEVGLSDGDEVVMVVSMDRNGQGGFLYDPERQGLARHGFSMPNPRAVDRRQVLDLLRQAEPAREYIFVWRHKGEKELQKRLTTVRQRPLWRFFPTRAEEGSNWVLWRWRDFYFDTQDIQSQRLVGWQVQYRDPMRTPDFYPLASLGGTDRLGGKEGWVGLHDPSRVWKFVKLPRQDPQKVLFPEIEPPQVQLSVVGYPVGNSDLVVQATVRPHDASARQQIARVVLWLDDSQFDDPALSLVRGAVNGRVMIPRARLRQGINEITLVAYNAEGGRSVARIEVDYQDPTRPRPTLFGVCVGIDDYRRARNFEELANLRYASSDAAIVAKVLQQHAGSRVFGRCEVQLVPQEEATAREILRRLGEVAKKAGPDDWLVVFLSGHGFGTNEPGSFSYVCSDTDALRRETRLTGAQLYQVLRGARCRKWILLDACRSGSVVSPPIQALERDGVQFLIFTACRPEQEAHEPTPAALRAHAKLRPQGLFTQALLEALGPPDTVGKAGRQKPVTARQLAESIQESMAKLLPLVGKAAGDQTPEFVPPRREMPRIEILSRP